MLTPSLNTVMTRLLIVAAVLATLIVFVLPSTFAQADEMVKYAENGTDAVRTFTSTDPEGAGIDWDVTGLDADDFVIDERGVLMFKKSPNYEKPTDREVPDGDDADTDPDVVGGNNMYHIVVRATEQTTSGADVRALSTETVVVVEVTNVNETGTASMNVLQPEVAWPVKARLSDVDSTDGALDIGDTVGEGEDTVTLGWTWYLSKVSNPVADVDDHWIAATGPVTADTTDPRNSTYTPAGERVAGASAIDGITGDVAVDEGKYLRAVVKYLDMGNDTTNTGDDAPTVSDVRTAIVVSENPVRAEVSSDNDNVDENLPANPENGSPGFSSTGDYARSIPENSAAGTPVGAAVVATEPNAADILTYELDNDKDPNSAFSSPTETLEPITAPNVNDVTLFKVGMANGQIYVNGTLNHEGPQDGVYKFYIRATDPSGQRDEQVITVTVTDQNDAPRIMASLTELERTNNADTDTTNDTSTAAESELRVWEEDSDDRDGNGSPDDPYTGLPDMPLPGVTVNDVVVAGIGAPNVFTATDQDTRGQIFWTLEGEDADDFVLTSTGLPVLTGLGGPDEPIAIRFANPPDFENPTDANLDNVYKVTMVATDSPGARATRDLTIFVDNQYEQGAVVLSDEQPLIGQAIAATIEDPDNNVAVVTWQWQRATTAAATTWEVIKGATASTYVPRADDKSTTEMEQDDNGYYLRVVATYTDVTSDRDMMTTDSVYTDERTADKTTETEDVPVAKVATEGDGTPTDTDPPDKLYRVMTTSANAVRVAPTDPSEVAAPEFASNSFDRMVAENAEVRSIVGDPVQVVPELDDKGKPKTAFTYDIEASITGDEAFFTIDPDSGQIRVGEVEFPDPIPAEVSPAATGVTEPAMVDPTLDYEGDNTFSLIVTATDKESGSRKATTVVNISLANLNEAPYFDRESRDKAAADVDHDNDDTNDDIVAILYAETRTNPVVQLAAVEPDGTALRWELTGVDASDFAIEDVEDVNDGKDRVQLVFASQPNFESHKDGAGDTNRDGTDDSATAAALEAAGDGMYHVTVRATEMTAVGGGPAMADTLDLNVLVTNSAEAGGVNFAWLQPEVGTEMTAILSDPDGDPIGAVAYHWFRSKVSNPRLNPGSTDAALAGEWERIESEWEGLSGNACAPTDASADAPDDATYTPQGDCAETAGTNENTTLGDEIDEGDFLLVRAVYEDAAGAATSTGITAYAVREDVSHDANNSPDFNANTATRTIAEDASKGDPVGDPVVVVQNEDEDILTYEIVEACRTNVDDTPCAADADPVPAVNAANGNNSVVPGDLASFDIDPATGQIMVDGTISYEADGAVRGAYKLVVRATDPSGEPNGQDRDDIVVTINVTDVNEAPKVTEGAFEMSVDEINSTAKDSDVRKYVGLGYEVVDGADATPNTADDVQAHIEGDPNLYKRSEEDLVDRAIWPEPIAGPDGALFEYSIPADGIGRRLHFKEAPDFENPLDANRDNVYEVMVTVQDSAGAMGTRNVRVTVMNVDEAGKLVLSPEQPDDGMPVVGTITDPDGVVSITNWAWATAISTRVVGTPAVDANNDGAPDVGAPWTVVPTATTDEYMAEAGRFVWAMVEYRDGHSVTDDPVTVLDERNDMPNTATDEGVEQHKYPTDTNDNGTISEAERTADELFHNSDRTRSGVTDNAVQPDPDDPDAPTGPSTGVVRIDRTVYENVPSTGYVGVPIEDLGYKIPGDTTEYMRDTISGPDGSSFVFAEDYDHAAGRTIHTTNAAYEDDPFYVFYDDVGMLQGTGTAGARVDISDDKVGQLALNPVTHLDTEGKDTYVIEISDPDATIAVSTYRVTITVMDVNDPPTAPSELKGPPPSLNAAPMFLDANGDVATSTYRMVAENTVAGTAIGDPVAAIDSDRGDQETVVYTLGGADAASFTIDSATGQLGTSAPLDFETKSEFMVTVTATDDDEASSMIYVTIMVTDVGLDTPYDADESGAIDSGEVLTAVADYFNGDIDDPTVLAVVTHYFAGL